MKGYTIDHNTLKCVPCNVTPRKPRACAFQDSECPVPFREARDAHLATLARADPPQVQYYKKGVGETVMKPDGTPEKDKDGYDKKQYRCVACDCPDSATKKCSKVAPCNLDVSGCNQQGYIIDGGPAKYR